MRACAKINLGLNVTERRNDGFHNIETVFLPVPLFDTLDISDNASPDIPCLLDITGDAIDCDKKKNLVVRAYDLLAQDFSLPNITITLNKRIPAGAGLGGGSSDAAATLRLLNEHLSLGLTVKQTERYAAALGADCPFFVRSQTAYAEGIGDKLYPIPGIRNKLCGMRLAIVKPPVSVSTREAYAAITPRRPARHCLDIVMQPVETWRDLLINDFEEPVFARHGELSEIKTTLYRLGAVYASMTGSGSAIYAFFPTSNSIGKLQLRRIFPECFATMVSIRRDAEI
ncbi:MAG: 4-(cytidine 5'-diphospho)-2-C-methyl-D-erythritol kinase [Prevotella sp.]|nr:4-(cytidine 5'-diphospho)-2-C-methyl-D-erythritol kinase [Prevotella sp.]